MESVFDLRKGTVTLGSSRVLHDVDLRMVRGEFTALLGPNGSGKTTLVRALLGLAPLTRGTLSLFGQPLAAFRAWHRIGYVPQRLTAASGVPATVEEVVLSGRVARTTFFRSFGARDRESVRSALQQVDLLGAAGHPVARLSGGQQQRVLIARALVCDPDVLVLDEPISSVDLEHQQGFATALERLKAEGHAVLLVAHSLGVVAPLVDRAVVLGAGTIVHDGPPEGAAREPHVHHAAEHDTSVALERTLGNGP